jgi:hypothetical protein
MASNHHLTAEVFMVKQLKRNRERAMRVKASLKYYKGTHLTETGPVEYSDLVDFMVDIRHYCDMVNECHGDADQTAHHHYLAELGGE